MMKDDYFWGLGYHPSGSQLLQQQHNGSTESSRGRSYQEQLPSSQQHQQRGAVVESTSAAVDSLMAHYLQQCLDYHNLQLQQEQQQQQQQKHEGNYQQEQEVHQSNVDNTFPQFVPAGPEQPLPESSSISTSHDALPRGPPTNIYISTNHESSSYAPSPNNMTTMNSTTPSVSNYPPSEITTSEPTVATDIQTAAMQARAKAMAVIQSFSKPATLASSASYAQQQVQSLVYGFNTISSTATSDCFLKRQECLQKEQQRKEKAMFKNFAYVSLREEQRLVKALADIEQTKQKEIELARHHAAVLEERKKRLRPHNNNLTTATFGIGTEERQKLENKKQRTQQQQQQRRGGDQDQSASVAIYVSGLSSEITDETLRPWFGAYAKLRKIHIYRDKATGKAKGDSLVIYHISAEDDASTLIQSVCEQMNGAELPDGSVLHVEPAESNQTSVTKKSSSSGSPSKIKVEPGTNGNGQGKDLGNQGNEAATVRTQSGEVATEDLDDFFASL